MDRRHLYSPIRLRIRIAEIATWISIEIENRSSRASLVKLFLLSTSTRERFSVNRSVPYVVRVEATTQGQVNGATEGRVTFLSVVLNEIEDYIIISQVWVPSSSCRLIVILEDCVQLSAKKIYVSTARWAVAKYDLSLIEGLVERATSNNLDLQTKDETTIYALARDRGAPCLVHAPVKYVEPLRIDYVSKVFHHPVHLKILHLQIQGSSTPEILLDNKGDVVAL